MSLRNKLFLACESFLRVPPLLVVDEIFRTSFGFGGRPFNYGGGGVEGIQSSMSMDVVNSQEGGNGHEASPTIASLAEYLRESWLWGYEALKNGSIIQQQEDLSAFVRSSQKLSSSLEDWSKLTDQIADDLIIVGQILGSLVLFFAAVIMFMLATDNLIKLYSYIVSFVTLYAAYISPSFTLAPSLSDVFFLSMNITCRTALAAVFFVCKTWSRTGRSSSRVMDSLLLSLFFISGFLPVPPALFTTFVIILHHSLIKLLPQLYAFLMLSWGDTKRVQNEYGLSHLIQVESGRLRINTVFRLFWMARAAYDAFYRCCDEPFSLIIRYVMVHGTETFTGIVGLTVTVAAICHQLGDFLLWLLYLGANNEVDLNRFGSISTVLFFILSLQSGLTSLDPEKRLDRLMKNIALLGTALFHALHQLVAPLLHAFRSFQAVQIRAAVLSFVFLSVSVGLTVSLLKWATISTWSLAVLALAIEFKIKVVISLVISLVVYLSQLVQYPDMVERTVCFLRRILPRVVMHYFDKLYDQVSHEDMVFYLKTVANVVEFVTGIFLFFNAVWIFLFESTSAIRAIGMSIHAYFNIWCEAQKGFRIYSQRKTASKKIMSLKDATDDQLRLRSDDVCSICYESFESAKVTNCGHLFHAVCLRKWLYVQNTCPMCHEILYKEDATTEQSSEPDRAGQRQNRVNPNRNPPVADVAESDEGEEEGQGVNRNHRRVGVERETLQAYRERMLEVVNDSEGSEVEDDYDSDLLQDLEEDEEASDSFVELEEVEGWNGDRDRDNRGHREGGIQAADGRGLVLFL